jgi:hypothetical protein
MKGLTVTDVDHHAEEILQALSFQGVERNFPRMLLVERAEVLIGDAYGVVAALFPIITDSQPAVVDPALNRLRTAVKNCSQFFPGGSLTNSGTYSCSITDDNSLKFCP